MENLKISEMLVDDTLTGVELIPIIKDKQNRSTTVDTLKKTIGGGLATETFVTEKIGEIKHPSLPEGLATETFVTEKIGEIKHPSLPEGLATETFVTEKIGEIVIPVIPANLATETFVTEKIGEIVIPVIPANLATETFVTEKIGEIKHPSLPEGLATETFVTEKIKEIPSSGTVLLFDTESLTNLYSSTAEEQICEQLGKTKEQIKAMVKNILNEKYDRIEIRFNQGGPYYYYSPVSVYCAEENGSDFCCTFNFIWFDRMYSITLMCFSDVLSVSRFYDKIVTRVDVVNRLDSNQWALPLAASQGKVLNETKANKADVYEKNDVYTKEEINALLAAINPVP